MQKGIISIVSTFSGAIVGMFAATARKNKEIRKWKDMSDKHFQLYMMMNQWIKIKQENKSIADYFERNGYKNIAIYGMNYVGKTLLDELTGSGIKVKYAIDKNADNIYTDIDIITPDDDYAKVDAVIVTPITFYDEIEKFVTNKIDCPILSLEDILYEVFRESVNR